MFDINREPEEIPGPERRHDGKTVRGLFGRIARRYDLTNDVMSLGLHRRWKRYLLELADLEPGFRVLDLAAGTGDLALGSADRGIGASSTREGSVVAADLTPPMIKVGRQRRGADSVLWTGGDALHLPFRDETFDRVVIGYGLRNFADLDCGLTEIRRCLKPGGKLLSLDFGKPPISASRRPRRCDASTFAIWKQVALSSVGYCTGMSTRISTFRSLFAAIRPSRN
jgi:demethylmenaquinone methyltransferase/2-methoxy-6-polyprenyl-1,4-benzoquinol methylase